MQAKLNKPSVVHYSCRSESDYYDIWLDPTQMVPVPWVIDCWVDNIKLSYDNATRTTNNSPGVEIRVNGWGSVSTMDVVDTTPLINQYDYGYYFYNIISALVARGYDKDKNMYGAPYDFRKGPNENREWFPKLQALTEKAFADNGNERVTFIAHSMGGRMILHFLQQMTTEWKDKHVEQIITLSVPCGGSVQTLQAISVGYDFGSEFIQNDKMKQVQETCPSVAWLLPSNYFWKPNEVLVNTKNKNYTTNDIDDFFYDINNPYTVEMRKDLAAYQNFSSPGVDVHCLYGTNIGDTVDRLDFGAAFNPTPTLIRGNGDGTVNHRSLIGCGYWQDTIAQNNHKVFQQGFPNVEHYNLLGDNRAINYILNRLVGVSDYPLEWERKNQTDFMKIRIF